MFWHAAMSAGTIEGDKLRISQKQFQALCQEHFGSWSLGNLIHEVVKPIANAIGKEDCSECAERQLKLNAL